MSPLRPAVAAALLLLCTVAAPASAGGYDVNTVLDITFPVDGPNTYTDTYDACRSGCSREHKATDIMTATGTPVHAAMGGVITWITGTSGNPPSYGYMITIRGDDGFHYSYVHLGTQSGSPSQAYAPGMRDGLRVERGQHIGYAGCSGNASCSGPHLHFEIEDRSRSTDDHYGVFRFNPYPSLKDAERRGDVPGASRAVPVEAAGSPSTFHPLPPKRILDTRIGLGAPEGRMSGGQVQRLQVTGRGGVPDSGVTAVVLNLTVTSPSRDGYITAYPTGGARPNASNVNFVGGETRPNLVTVKVGSGGRIDLFNFAGRVHLIADIAGYYGPNGGTSFVPLSPARVLDTRYGVGGPSTPVPHRGIRKVQVAGVGGVPGDAAAVVMNVTGTEPRATETYLTVWPTGKQRPVASNVNLRRGDTIPNLAIVPVGEGGRVNLYNHSGNTDVIFDVAGYYRSGSGDVFVPVEPTRVLDTRNGTGARPGSVRHGMTLDLSGIDDPSATAVVLNVTVTEPTTASHLTVYPTGERMPVASNQNFGPGRTAANLVVVKLGQGRRVDLFNHYGRVHLVADVAGYMTDG